MKKNSISRIQKELDTLQKDPIDGIKLGECSPDYNLATFLLSGPIDSPYEGHWFRVLVQWDGYPYEPPIIKFLDKVWNPYVSFQQNYVCADILKKGNFSPALTTPKILLSIVSLLGETKITEDHNGFLNPKAASMMMNNYPCFCQEARKYCELYSFKKHEIYQKVQRGLPQEHFIKAEGKELEELVEKDAKNPEMLKKIKMIKITVSKY